MNRKGIIFTILMALAGLALGVGGTLGVQKLFFDHEPSAAATHKKAGPVVSVGDFTVNLQGGAFLKASIAVEGLDEKSQEALTEKVPFLKDRINMVLSSKTLADVQPASREKLKNELIAQLNQVAENKINDILFLSFVYQ